jgi:hypothetical protein
VGLLQIFAPAAHAACAKVVIQIVQELTFERDGFEARLGITNNLPTALDNFQVTLRFTDADGNAVGAYTTGAGSGGDKFFYRAQTGYSMPTSIAGGAEKQMAYLIVPAPGAAGATATGALYFVGATLRFMADGVEQVLEVAPDSITVKPMPLLRLQYFLPGDVYGDDPHTLPVEAVVPFALGLRTINQSPFATARNVGVVAGQPEIVDNEQGLLVAFSILGSQVNGLASLPSLKIKLGDIAPRSSTLASWSMTASLSGTFGKFSAEVEHAPEFGGALTSLIPPDAITTHRLIGQVLVDLPGRDGRLDFLATDTMTGPLTAVKAFESDNDAISTPVDYIAPNASEVSIAPVGGAVYSLTVNAASDLLYVKLASPISSDQTVRAIRSDGKALPYANCWISKTRDGAGPWQYWLNLFDTNKTAPQSYALTFSTATQDNQTPVLSFPGGRNYAVVQGQVLTVQVSGVDPDGLIPTLSTGLLPDGAVFNNSGTGTGTLTWTPTASQLGTYSIQFRASDGLATDAKSIEVQVVDSSSAAYAAWAGQYWPGVTDQAVIGPAADPDRDQLSNLLEYGLGGDPTQPDDSILPVIAKETVGDLVYLTLTYQRRTNDPALLFEVVASDTLGAPLSLWTVQSETLAVSQDNLPAGMQRVKVRDSLPLSALPTNARYLRLRLTGN